MQQSTQSAGSETAPNRLLDHGLHYGQALDVLSTVMSVPRKKAEQMVLSYVTQSS